MKSQSKAAPKGAQIKVPKTVPPLGRHPDGKFASGGAVVSSLKSALGHCGGGK